MVKKFEVRKYYNIAGHPKRKCVYVHTDGSAVLTGPGPCGIQIAGDPKNWDEVIPEVVSEWHFYIQSRGTVGPISTTKTKVDTHKLTLTNRGGEITARVEKL